MKSSLHVNKRNQTGQPTLTATSNFSKLPLLSLVSTCLELELNKLDVVLMEPHRQSPKTKALRTGTSHRRKGTLVHHLRPAGNMDEAFSPVTTPEDEEDIHHIKHVAGQPTTGLWSVKYCRTDCEQQHLNFILFFLRLCHSPFFLFLSLLQVPHRPDTFPKLQEALHFTTSPNCCFSSALCE